jgi:SAM-dependent methyltransferase
VSAAISVVESQAVASPFDGIAAEYDAIFTDSRIGHAQRSAVWAELAGAFHPGDRILEVGCGTGVDACFLAERGVSVVACDSSREMIRVAQGRACNRLCFFRNAAVTFRQCAAEQLGRFSSYLPFDGAFSNFGVLNCIADLRQFAQTLAPLLKPSARVLLCLMGPCCAWEFIWLACHGDLKRATRRLRGSRTIATVGAGTVNVHYPTLRALRRAFRPEFCLRAVKGIGVAVPPTYFSPLVNRFPRVLDAAALLDRALARCPGIQILADHILLTLERTSS